MLQVPTPEIRIQCAALPPAAGPANADYAIHPENPGQPRLVPFLPALEAGIALGQNGKHQQRIPMGEDWSAWEVEIIVEDYLSMLQSELRGEPFNKAEHRRNLLELLPARNEGGVEFKRSAEYHVYRLFDFQMKPRLFLLNGSMHSTCTLEAVQFRAIPGAIED